MSRLFFRRGLAVALVAGLGFAFQTTGAHAATVDVEVDAVTYRVDPDAPGQGATLIGFNRARIARNLTIPATVSHGGTTYPVKRIGEEGLRSARLKTVTLPEGLEEIGKAAFYGNSIDDLVIPDSVTGIGEQAFMNNHMKTVVLPKKLTEIKASTFVNNNLTSVDLPAGLTTIGPAAFASCRLTSLVLPESVTSVGASAFEANALTGVTIPKGLTSLAAGVFSNNKLTSVEIPETVTSLGKEAFAGNKLTSLRLPKSITTIPERAFHSNELASVTLPEELTEIQEAAFEYNNLVSLTIPAKVTTIAKRAFGSNALTSVRMEGPAPTIHAPGRWSPNTGSFGDPRDLKVSHYCHLADGYTRPTWSGYTLADGCIVVTAKGDGATEPAKPSFDPNADDDGDGFTNAEEVKAGTDPFDPASHPTRPTPSPSTAESASVPGTKPVDPAPTGVTSQVINPVRPGLPRTGATNI